MVDWLCVIIKDKSIQINWGPVSILPCGQRRLHHIAMFRSNVLTWGNLWENICQKVTTTRSERQRRWKNFISTIKLFLFCLLRNSKENLPKVLIYLISTLLFLSCFWLFPLDPTQPPSPHVLQYVCDNVCVDTHTHTQFVDNKSQIYHSLSRLTSQPWPYQHFYWSQHANITAVLRGQHDEHKMRCEYIAGDMDWK